MKFLIPTTAILSSLFGAALAATTPCDSTCVHRLLFRTAYSSAASGANLAFDACDAYAWCKTDAGDWCPDVMDSTITSLAERMVETSDVDFNAMDNAGLLSAMSSISRESTKLAIAVTGSILANSSLECGEKGDKKLRELYWTLDAADDPIEHDGATIDKKIEDAKPVAPKDQEDHDIDDVLPWLAAPAALLGPLIGVGFCANDPVLCKDATSKFLGKVFQVAKDLLPKGNPLPEIVSEATGEILEDVFSSPLDRWLDNLVKNPADWFENGREPWESQELPPEEEEKLRPIPEEDEPVEGEPEDEAEDLPGEKPEKGLESEGEPEGDLEHDEPSDAEPGNDAEDAATDQPEKGSEHAPSEGNPESDPWTSDFDADGEDTSLGEPSEGELTPVDEIGQPPVPVPDDDSPVLTPEEPAPAPEPVPGEPVPVPGEPVPVPGEPVSVPVPGEPVPVPAPAPPLLIPELAPIPEVPLPSVSLPGPQIPSLPGPSTAAPIEMFSETYLKWNGQTTVEATRQLRKITDPDTLAKVLEKGKSTPWGTGYRPFELLDEGGEVVKQVWRKPEALRSLSGPWAKVGESFVKVSERAEPIINALGEPIVASEAGRVVSLRPVAVAGAHLAEDGATVAVDLGKAAFGGAAAGLSGAGVLFGMFSSDDDQAEPELLSFDPVKGDVDVVAADGSYKDHDDDHKDAEDGEEDEAGSESTVTVTDGNPTTVTTGTPAASPSSPDDKATQMSTTSVSQQQPPSETGEDESNPKDPPTKSPSQTPSPKSTSPLSSPEPSSETGESTTTQAKTSSSSSSYSSPSTPTDTTLITSVKWLTSTTQITATTNPPPTPTIADLPTLTTTLLGCKHLAHCPICPKPGTCSIGPIPPECINDVLGMRGQELWSPGTREKCFAPLWAASREERKTWVANVAAPRCVSTDEWEPVDDDREHGGECYYSMREANDAESRAWISGLLPLECPYDEGDPTWEEIDDAELRKECSRVAARLEKPFEQD